MSQQYGYPQPPPQQHYGGYPQAGYGGPPPPQSGYGYPPAGPQVGYRPPHPHHHAPQPHIQPPPPVQVAQTPQPVAAASAPVVPYIGARISLISVMGVRYEGTLYTIDTKASTVALQHVTCFGTEDRPAENGFMPPSNNVYEFIIFGGKDIKDLSVLQPKPSQPTPHDPAILSTAQPPQQPPQPTQPAPAEEEELEVVDGSSSQHAPQQHQQRQHQHQNQNRAPRGGRQQQPRSDQKHTVRMIDDQRRGGNNHHQQQQQSTAENQAPFDFQSSNQKFTKVTEAPSSSSSSSVPSYELPSADAAQLDTSGFPVVTKKYDKSKGFFDELTLDKGRVDPAERREMRRVDADTFGSDAAHYRSKHNNRGGGRGGYRGGRGRGGQGGQRGGQSNGGGQWRQA